MHNDIYNEIYIFVYDITGPIDDSSYDPMPIFYLRDDEILFGWRYLRHSLRHYVIVALILSTRHFDTFSSRPQCIYYICNYAILRDRFRSLLPFVSSSHDAQAGSTVRERTIPALDTTA